MVLTGSAVFISGANDNRDYVMCLNILYRINKILLNRIEHYYTQEKKN